MSIFFEAANRVLKPFGHKLVRSGADLLHYQHDYGEQGYAEYRKVQIEHNKRKLDHVWAEERTLELIVDYIKGHGGAKRGICHGARNGWEVKYFHDALGCEVVGTDISETAGQFENMVHWDFHDEREDWKNAFSFVYTNSLDQSFDPAKALNAWSGQLTDDGHIFIEHTMYHSASGASEMDPFGAHPMIMPYLFFEWGRGRYELKDILKLNDVKMSSRGVVTEKGQVWVFVLGKAGPAK